jgi:HAE1 family hydrophobic/amphiphilic exporter-1
MFLLAALLLGAVSLGRLEVTLLPEVKPQHILVWIAYPDAGVLEIEETVARPVEEAVVTARGVRDVRVNIVPGGLSATVLLQPGSDPEVVALGVRERLDAVRWQFPDEVQRPVLLGTGGVEAPDLVLALAADDLAGAGDWARHVLRKRLEQIDGVARAQVVGEPRREIRVIPDPDALAFAGVSVQQISAALAAANVPATGGLLRRRGVR